MHVQTFFVGVFHECINGHVFYVFVSFQNLILLFLISNAGQEETKETVSFQRFRESQGASPAEPKKGDLRKKSGNS